MINSIRGNKLLAEKKTWKKTGEKDKKSQICFAGFQKRCIFAPEIKKGHQMSSKRCGSSAWLEYMPVTHGVAGSSPVRTAINIENQCFTKQTPDFTPKNVKSGVLYLELPDFIFARIVVISTQPQGFPNNLLIP